MSVYKKAFLSLDGTYRFGLERALEQGGKPENTINFVMLNPSTADAEIDDPTIRRCMDFAWTWGYKRLLVTNLFPLRATDPKELYSHHDPLCAPVNQHYMELAALISDKVICAWGKHGSFMYQGKKALRTLKECNNNVCHLGLNGDGSPKHPLYLKKSTTPEKFDA